MVYTVYEITILLVAKVLIKLEIKVQSGVISAHYYNDRVKHQVI